MNPFGKERAMRFEDMGLRIQTSKFNRFPIAKQLRQIQIYGIDKMLDNLNEFARPAETIITTASLNGEIYKAGHKVHAFNGKKAY